MSRLILYRYLGGRCQYCDLSVEESLRRFHTHAGFDLHHIDPAKKSPEYENMIRRKLSTEQFDEADKCALLCKVCHARIHGQNQTINVTFTLNHPDVPPIVHTLTCQLLEDYEKQEVVLFSDQFQYLDLYRIRQTGKQPTVLSGIQLEPLLDGMFEETQNDVQLKIETMSGDVVCTAEKNSEQQLEVAMNVDFPLLKVQLSFASGTQQMNWHLRSGRIVITGPSDYFMRSYGRAWIKMFSKYREHEVT